MPAPFGVTDTGFSMPTMEELADEIRADVRAAAGPLDLSNRTIEGQYILILAERLHRIYQILQVLYSATDPDSAVGAPLEALSLITGTFRRGPSQSTVTLTLCGDPATAVAAFSRASTEAGDVFETTEGVTLAALDAWVATTAYVLDDRVTNSSRCYLCTATGISAGAGGPTNTGADITDGTVHWKYLGEGTAAADAPARSVETGPIQGVAADIETIETPVSGWETVTNLEDAVPGRTTDTDETLRLRRERGVTRASTGTPPGLRAALADVEGVTAVRIFVNNTDETFLDIDGDPDQTPHSVECVVLDGDDEDVAKRIQANLGIGIATYSDTSGIHGVEVEVTNEDGEIETIKFTRPAEVEIYLEVSVEVDEDEFPEDGAEQIKLAIVTWYQSNRSTGKAIGMNLRISAVSAQCFAVDGVLEVTEVLMKDGSAPGPGDDETIDCNKREIAALDTSRIVVNVSAGVV